MLSCHMACHCPGTELPDPDIELPDPDIELPGPDIELPGPDIELPGPDIELPSSGHRTVIVRVPHWTGPAPAPAGRWRL
jgi:hypothetical protein